MFHVPRESKESHQSKSNKGQVCYDWAQHELNSLSLGNQRPSPLSSFSTLQTTCSYLHVNYHVCQPSQVGRLHKRTAIPCSYSQLGLLLEEILPLSSLLCQMVRNHMVQRGFKGQSSFPQLGSLSQNRPSKTGQLDTHYCRA